MRSIHTALAAAVSDKGHWPQEKEETWMVNRNAYEDWWIETLKPYGIGEESWRCPTIYRTVTKRTDENRPKLHYTPTMFDNKPLTPYKWSTQPWLIEIGNMHGRGALMCFPDGSIRSMDEVMQKR
jgi:hypothetical protein